MELKDYFLKVIEKWWLSSAATPEIRRKQCASELADAVKAFVEWEDEYVEKVDNRYFVIKEQLQFRTIWEDVEFKNLDELFAYFIEKIYKK